MSPVTVVLYVVFFYLVWQILTRSDDEILSHLPSSSPLLAHHGVEQRPSPLSPNTQPSTPYQFPYAVPQLPPPTALSESTGSSTWRTVLNSLIYPFYLCITLLAIPLPFLLNGLHLLASVVSTILYPVTWTARLLARTFIITPLHVVLSFLNALYPVYVFVGGVVGVGAVLGVAVGWFGQLIMWLLLGRKSPKKSSKKKRSSKRHSAPVVSDYERDRRGHEGRDGRDSRERRASAELRSVSPSALYEYERRYLPIVDYVQIGDEMVGIDSRGSAREAVVLGLRRRGMRA